MVMVVVLDHRNIAIGSIVCTIRMIIPLRVHIRILVEVVSRSPVLLQQGEFSREIISLVANLVINRTIVPSF